MKRYLFWLSSLASLGQSPYQQMEIRRAKRLWTAFGFSMLLHGLLLSIHFHAPKTFNMTSSLSNLDIILVNAKHDKAPTNPDALAQANLKGGGTKVEGRSKSPLPNMMSANTEQTALSSVSQMPITAATSSASTLSSQVEEMNKAKIIKAMEKEQKVLLSKLKKRSNADIQYRSPELIGQATPLAPSTDQSQNQTINMAKDYALSLREAEIAKNIELYNKRPQKTQITPNTREVGYAMYYKNLQNRIEQIGTLNFPQRNGKRLYGKLIVYIPIFQDGTIYQKEEGVKIERSSGNPHLDKVALDIIRRSSPFGSFPQHMRTKEKDDVWEIITTMNFTHEGNLETTFD